MKLLNTLLCSHLCASFCCAQSTTPKPPVRTSLGSDSSNALFIGYMYGRSDYTAPIKNYNGGAVQLDLMRTHRWGFAIDGSYAKSNLDSSQWQMLFGPRFQFGGQRSTFGVT